MDFLSQLFPILAGLAPIVIILIVIAALGALAFVAFRLLVLRRFFQEFGGILKDLFGLVIPKKWDSPKTLLALGAFSWAVSVIVGTTAQSIIAFVGWIFLIAGVHWVMHDEKDLKKTLTINGIFIGPWITGALICYFLFATTEGIPAIAFILWPVVSAMIAGIPKFIGSNSAQQTPIWVKPKPDDRQFLVNLALINLLLSCWLQLGFTTRQWLADYPTLQTANLSNSPFMIQLQSGSPTTSRGVEILARTEAAVKASLQGQSWSQVERWLLNFNDNLEQIEAMVMSQMSKAKENDYWQVQGQILPGEYNIRLASVWQGPSADAAGFHFAQTCQISRVAPVDIAGQTANTTAPLPAVGNAQVQCRPIEGPIEGQPGSGDLRNQESENGNREPEFRSPESERERGEEPAGRRY
ncbi:MAG: DUF5357 family protein [Leptolyngbyaceae cyanobacterium bins.302]|nr:DUF5357 family protein [Leptolyngbyaceae cyanobacterium bins.302]